MSDTEETPYSERPDWKDITPIPLPCGDVVQIMYSDRFKDVYSYMAAIMQKKEYSLRAFELTTDAIDLNAANYTVWHYRREILRNMNISLDQEVEFADGVIKDQPKNYQVWHHRRCLIEMTGDPSKELDLTATTLGKDAKNYHAWDHRQWVVSQYNLWEGELDFVEKLLQEDLRNNSAWNHRYFVVTNTTGWNKEVIERELEYTKAYINKAPNNESPWNYATGMIKGNGHSMVDFKSFVDMCEDLYSRQIRSPFGLKVLAEIREEREDYAKAIDIYMVLKETPTVRDRYWDYKVQCIRELMTC